MLSFPRTLYSGIIPDLICSAKPLILNEVVDAVQVCSIERMGRKAGVLGEVLRASFDGAECQSQASGPVISPRHQARSSGVFLTSYIGN